MRIRDGLVAGLVIALAAAGCASDEVVTDVTGGDDLAAGTAADSDAAPADAAEERPTASAEEPDELEIDFVGAMELDPKEALPGTDVAVSGSDLPPGEELTLTWFTVDCDWVLDGEQNENYMGRRCTERRDPIETVTVDDDGSLGASFVVPDDYGFAHDVALIDTGGVLRNKALFRIATQVSVTPESGPVGTPITVEVKGMGWQSLEDTRTILYDNRYVGFMSAVTTQGTARATITATGAVGPHHIDINRGAYTFPYLNPEQSPRPDILTYDATFTVTEGPPVLAATIDEQNPAVVRQAPALDGDRPTVATDLVSGPVGTSFTVAGEGFSPDEPVLLQWFRIVGNRVSGQGWDEKSVDLGQAEVASDGSFEFAAEIPGDVGGGHRIEASQAGDVLAETSVVVTPEAQPVESTSVSWGTEVVLHVTGVGWTETANIYTVIYDNAYVGYACGFNTQGDVQIPLVLTGEPGWHFVELYPAIYKGEELRGRNNFRIPQLTALDDHPGEELPVFRYAFEITGE